MSNNYVVGTQHGIEFFDGTPVYAGGYGKRFDFIGCPGSYVGIVGDNSAYIDVTIPINCLWELQSIQIDSFRGFMTTNTDKIVDQFNLSSVNMKNWYPDTHVIQGIGANIQIRIPARSVNNGKFKAYTKGTATHTNLKAGDIVYLHLKEFKFHNIF